MINPFTFVLLGFLIICAIAACFCKNFLTSVIIFMSYSVVMSILWMVLESPDLAITEAAVGAGVTSVLFFVTLKKIHAMNDKKNVDNKAPMDDKEKDRSADM